LVHIWKTRFFLIVFLPGERLTMTDEPLYCFLQNPLL
jgi:hypothetical protein